MKIRYYIFFIIALFIMPSCSTWKKSLSTSGSIDVAINNSITDFINTSKLFKADSIFVIDITDQEDLYIIGIGGAVNKVYPYIRDTIGAKNDLFPTKYMVIEEKLFYWNDPDQGITQEIIDILSQYDAIDLAWRDREYNIPLNISDGEYGEKVYIPPMVIDDAQKGLVYYICKNDFTNYKKTGFNTILRHYKQPKLRCYN
jgi:hypothetical protein